MRTLGGLYLAQGIPTYLLLVALPPIMRDSGASRTVIGLFSLLMLPVVLKFLIGPVVDKWSPIPSFGHRKGWIVPTQLLVSVTIAAMAFVTPDNSSVLFVLCLFVAIASSVQDVAADGYAVRSLDDKTRATGNAIQAGAGALGVLIGGTVSLVVFHHAGWHVMIALVTVLSLLPLLAIIAMQDTPATFIANEIVRSPRLSSFFHLPNALLILGFALTYRMSEGLVRGIDSIYLKDIGVPTDWIGFLSGGSAATAGILGVILAAFIIKKFGLTLVLVLLGGIRSLCFLTFSLNAFTLWPGTTIAMSASMFHILIRYMEMVALYSFFMKSSSQTQPGTDFTILACAELIVYVAGASVAGYFADIFGYEMLFSTATIVSILGVCVAIWFLRRIHEKPQKTFAVII